MSALQDSRARIIAAADAERRRLERDLHDGAQQRLVALSMSLGLANRCTVPVELDAVPETRLPEPVEAAACFTVAEALTNVAKYAQACSAHVAVAPGSRSASATTAWAEPTRSTSPNPSRSSRRRRRWPLRPPARPASARAASSGRTSSCTRASWSCWCSYG